MTGLQTYWITFAISTFFSSYLISADKSQFDCQQNEVFVVCGSCETTCKNPIRASCAVGCLPARCECKSDDGFVRAHDGNCIKATECSTYRGIYYSQSGIIVSNAPTQLDKPMLQTLSDRYVLPPTVPFVFPSNTQPVWPAIAVSSSYPVAPSNAKSNFGNTNVTSGISKALNVQQYVKPYQDSSVRFSPPNRKQVKVDNFETFNIFAPPTYPGHMGLEGSKVLVKKRLDNANYIPYNDNTFAKVNDSQSQTLVPAEIPLEFRIL